SRVKLGRSRGRAVAGCGTRSLFPSFADEHHAFGLVEMAELFIHDVILALSLLELNDRYLMIFGEALGCCHEALGHRVHEGRGGEGLAAVAAKEPYDPAFTLYG